MAHYQYFISDHLGNTRVIFEKLNDSVYLAQENHYGVWGELLQGIGTSGDWKFLFQGKEYVDAFGLNTYDFGWRMGDPYIGRWTSTDPADQFQNITGYGYMANNPLLYTDPDGRILPAVFIAAAVVGGGLNLWNNWSKIKDWKQGVGYFISGAAGGAVGVTNPLLGGGITSGANALIDIASGSMPSIKNFGDGAKYFLGETAKGIAFSFVGGQVGKYIGPKLGGFFDWVQQGFVKYAPGTAKIGNEVISWTYEAGVKASRKLFGQAGQAVGSSAANQLDGFADDFAQIPAKGLIDPKTIRFSQNSIAKTFKNGNNIDDFATGLKSGEINPTSIEPIRLVSKDGMTFTLDNRRLWAFQKAGIDIPFIKIDNIPQNQLFKFTTPNNGINILIR